MQTKKPSWKRYAAGIALSVLIAPGLAFAGTAEDAARGVHLYETSQYKAALPYLQKAADAGDARAQTYLGKAYSNGFAADKDDKKAFELYKKAAEKNYAPAQTRLGELYYKGRGTEQNFEEAEKWLEKAAAAGDTEALSFLGMVNLDSGKSENVKKAIDYFTKAAEKKEPLAQTLLGIMYIEGRYFKQDYKKAEELLSQAGEAGNVTAATVLGSLYYNGKGLEKNNEKAVKWLEKAAVRGDVDAQEMLYRIHHGTEKPKK